MEDISILKEIISHTKKISNTYRQLIKLDFQGEKSTSEYSLVLNELKENIKYEQILYNQLDLDEEKTMEYIFYMGRVSEFHGDVVTLKLNSSCSKNIEELLYYRINNKLQYYNKDKVDFIKTLQENKGDMTKEVLENFESLLITDVFTKETVRAFGFFLEEEILKCIDPQIRKKLIEVRYNLSFINTDIEEEYIYDKFINKEHLYLGYNLIGDIVGISKNKFNKSQCDTVYDGGCEIINTIGEMLEFEPEDTKPLQEVYSVLLGATLSLIYNNSESDDLILSIEDEVIEYENTHDIDDGILDNLIYKRLTLNNPDKQKCKYISFYNKK